MSKEILDSLNTQLSQLKDTVCLLEDRIEELEVAVDRIDEYYNVGLDFKDEIMSEIEAAENRMIEYTDDIESDLSNRITDNADTLEAMADDISNAESIAEEALDLAQTNESNLDDLDSKVAELDDNISDVVALVE